MTDRGTVEQTIPLSYDIWYWDEVLGSYTYTGLYTIQTSPLRFWEWVKDIYHDTRRRVSSLHNDPRSAFSTKDSTSSTRDRWRQFYGLVQDSVRDRSMADIRRRVLSPIAICRSEARRKQHGLKRLREMSASGLGVLMDEGLSFDIKDESTIGVKGEAVDSHEWKDVVEKSVSLMDTVLRNVTNLDTGVSEFEDVVFAGVDADPETAIYAADSASRPAVLSKRLQHMLDG